MVGQEERERGQMNQSLPEEPKESAQKENAQREAASDTVEIKRHEYEELLRKASELVELQDKLLRSAADFENAKKRLAKEREELFKFILEGTILDLLPILDNFDRALLHVNPGEEKIKSLCEGFRLIQKQLINILTERGVKRLEVVGKLFDPHAHEAVGYVVAEDKPEGIVMEEIVPGYELNGKLIRPAKVKLSRKKADQAMKSDEKEEELT